MICAYTSIHTLFSVKKGDPTIYFAKKKKNRMKLEGGYIKEHKPGKNRKKYCIILSVESLKVCSSLTVSCEFPFCVYSAGMKYLEGDFEIPRGTEALPISG